MGHGQLLERHGRTGADTGGRDGFGLAGAARDQRFVLDAPTSPAAATIVATVRELAYRLGLTAVAEGVEEEAHRAVVVEAGYDLLQGFHLSRPLPELDLLASLDRAPVIRTAAGAPRRASPGSPPAR